MTNNNGHQVIRIYTDGSAVPNPGRGGYGAVLIHPRKTSTISGGFRHTTNNRMELMAAIRALRALRFPCRVVVYSDCQVVIRAGNAVVIRSPSADQWRNITSRDNADLVLELRALCLDHISVDFVWVRGHSGDENNERAHHLANLGRMAPNPEVDRKYASWAAGEGRQPIRRTVEDGMVDLFEVE